MKEIVNKYKIIKNKRQAPNLKKLLTRAKYDKGEETPIVTKCGRPNCVTCHYLIEKNDFLFRCGKNFHTKTSM